MSTLSMLLTWWILTFRVKSESLKQLNWQAESCWLIFWYFALHSLYYSLNFSSFQRYTMFWNWSLIPLLNFLMMNQEESSQIRSIMFSFYINWQLLLSLLLISNFLSRVSVTKAFRLTPDSKTSSMIILEKLLVTMQSPYPIVGRVTMMTSRQSMKVISEMVRKRQCEQNSTTATQAYSTSKMPISLRITFQANSKVSQGFIPQRWMMRAARGLQKRLALMQYAKGKQARKSKLRWRRSSLPSQKAFGAIKMTRYLMIILRKKQFCVTLRLLLFQIQQQADAVAQRMSTSVSAE